VLRDLDLETSYRSGRNSLIDEFYVPCLQESLRYDRAVGYFSSTLYQVLAIAFSDFVRRGGRMRLICSPALSTGDFEAMKSADEVSRWAQQTVRDDLEMLLRNPQAVPATRLLGTLVANGIIDVRIAFADDPNGIFHDKLGIFEDDEGKRVSFTGSANETWRAWGLNHESFETFCSWKNESELLRTRGHNDNFSQMWRGQEPGVQVAYLEDVTREQLIAISESDLDYAVDQVRSLRQRPRDDPRSRPLMEHQRRVLADWETHNHRGIVNFATGAGKTLTAIDGIRRWAANGGASIVMVPGQDLHEQWIREIEQELPDAQILPAGGGHSKSNWLAMLPLFTTRENAGTAQRVVVVTNKTFASPDFQKRLRGGQHLLVVTDEMHRAGSRRVLPALESVESGATLGLSATFRRQFDPNGTDRLLEFFGEVLNPTIGLAEALMLDLLVPYDYRLHEVELEGDETLLYEQISDKIRHLMARGASVDDPDSPLRMQLIRRARVLKQARKKIPAAVQILRSEYREGDRWLVYCDDINQMRAVSQECLDAGLPVLEFYAGMRSERSAVLDSLRDHGGIVVAIRCLDEGIDVPVTDHALIVASSTVEREYIQRRGRVLRRSPSTGKVSAEVHDLILVDSIGGGLTKGEAQRALEFARLARNPASRDRLKAIVSLSRDPIGLPDDLDDDSEDSD